MAQTEKNKKFISIRAKLFFQVGAVILAAIIIILALNNFLLPAIYTRNEMSAMKEIAKEIDGISYTEAGFSDRISSYEKQNSLSIDIYLPDGTPLYYGTNDIFASGGKIVVSKREDFDDGSFFEIQTNAKEKAEYIVYGCKLADGCEIEMFSRKTTVDENANLAILITSATSVTALLAALIYIYFYTGRFTKPLISMSRITRRMAETDFSQKCDVKSNDEIGMLSADINHLSDSLNETLEDLHNKNKRLEEDIEKEKNLEKIRKDFISNVSHELKTPISIIRGYSEGAGLLLQSGDIKGAEDYCNVIVGETEKMNGLVLQLLELSMYESGGVKLKTENFNIRDLINGYASDNEIKFKEKGITFENNVSENQIGSGDIIKIEMIVNNYIQNAVSHADGEKKISVSSEEHGRDYRITVFNTGKHIADEDIDKIWLSFYRADKAHSRSENRFGLGLSIVSAIQKLHGEEYGAYNTDGGVCFWFDVKRGGGNEL